MEVCQYHSELTGKINDLDKKMDNISSEVVSLKVETGKISTHLEIIKEDISEIKKHLAASNNKMAKTQANIEALKAAKEQNPDNDTKGESYAYHYFNLLSNLILLVLMLLLSVKFYGWVS